MCGCSVVPRYDFLSPLVFPFSHVRTCRSALVSIKWAGGTLAKKSMLFSTCSDVRLEDGMTSIASAAFAFATAVSSARWKMPSRYPCQHKLDASTHTRIRLVVPSITTAVSCEMVDGRRASRASAVVGSVSRADVLSNITGFGSSEPSSTAAIGSKQRVWHGGRRRGPPQAAWRVGRPARRSRAAQARSRALL
jgi:hypothetical protein